MVKLYMNGPFSVEVFNIDVCFVASMSENVCILIEIAGENPYQDMCFFFLFFPGWWLHILRVFVEQISIPYGCQCG